LFIRVLGTCLEWFTPRKARLLTNLSILPQLSVSKQIKLGKKSKFSD
jgi:hypothetical protein